MVTETVLSALALSTPFALPALVHVWRRQRRRDELVYHRRHG